MLLRAVWILPLSAGVVALVLAGVLGRRFVVRRRPYEAAWIVALAMYAAASLAMSLGVLDGWSTREFRIYWALGAILNVPWLLMGELYLLLRSRWVADLALVVLLFLSAFAIGQVRTATVHVDALLKELPLGKEVFGDGSVPYRLAQLYAYPAYVLLLAACAWSLWRMRGRPELRDRFLGTLLIAAGATVVAAASGIGAGLGVIWVFSVGLLVGIALMFWGFLRASRPMAGPSPAT
jgi:hypothetical protein